MLTAEIKKITDWLIDGARSAPNPARMMAETCERLVQAGVPLWRVGVFVRTLHPDIYGRNFIWKPGAEVEIGSVDFGVQDLPEFRSSPLAIVFREGIEVRGRPDDPESKRFPIIEDMRAEGVTDYVALPLLFLVMSGMARANDIVVNTISGESEPFPLCSLPDAIGAHNTHSIINGCGPGTSNDRILFVVTGSIYLVGAVLGMLEEKSL